MYSDWSGVYVERGDHIYSAWSAMYVNWVNFTVTLFSFC